MAQSLDKLIIELSADLSGLKSGFSTATSDLRRFSNQAGAELRRFQTSIQSAGGAFAAYFSGRAMADIGRAIFSTGVQFEALRNKMEASVGSSTAAAEALKFSRDEADRLGLVFTDLADGYASFSAAALRAGMSAEEVQQVFTGVSEAATAMRLSQERVSLVFTALSQMASKGVVSMEELRQQLGESLPGAVQIFAKAMGVSNAEFVKLVENGKVSARELTKLGDELHKQFGEAAVEAANSAQAAVNRLTNTITDLKRTLAEGSFMESATNGINDFNRALSDPEGQRGLLVLREGLATLVDLAAAVGVFVTALASKIANDLFPALSDAAEAQRQLNAAMKDAVSYDKTTDTFTTTAPNRVKPVAPRDEKAENKAEKDRQRLASQVEALKYSLASETEQAALEYEKQQKLLEDALKKKAITEQEYRDLKLEAELEHKNRFAEIWQKETDERVAREQEVADSINGIRANTLNNAVGFLQVLGQKNKALALAALALEKGIAIARAIMETHVAAAAALKYDPTGATSAYVTKLGYANVAVIAATGVAQAAMMGGGGAGGGGGGYYGGEAVGAGMSNPGATQGQQAAQRKDINLTIQGSHWGPQDVRNLVLKLNEYIGDGSVRLNVAGATA